MVGAILGTSLSLPPALFTGAVNQFASDDIKDQLNIFHDDPYDEEAEMSNRVVDDEVDEETEKSDVLDTLIVGLSNSLEHEK